MAKLYGAYAGQPLQLLAQGLIGIVPPHCKDSNDHMLVRDYVTFNGNVVGDTISLGFIRSGAFVDLIRSYFASDSLGTGVTISLGDATHPNALMNARSFATTNGLTGALFDAAQVSAALLPAPLWQKLGWASDPGGHIELLATLGGAAPTNGTSLGWEVIGRA